MTIRTKYMPLIIRLTHRIDALSRKAIETGSAVAFVEYKILVEELCEIKDMIKEVEKREAV